MAMLSKTLGILGLLLITWGIFVKGSKQDMLFALGGILLLAYSSYLHDPIFIILQIIFTVSSLYEMYKFKKDARHQPIAISPEEVAKLITENHK